MVLLCDIPRKIRIGYQDYDINIVDSQLATEQLYGLINYDTQEIQLRACNTPEQNEVALLHETIHGISDYFDLDLDEREVKLLASGLYQVAKDLKGD